MDLMALITIFALAIFVGFEIITKVPPTLHTPLMSGSNAISGITIVGALLLAETAADPGTAAKPVDGAGAPRAEAAAEPAGGDASADGAATDDAANPSKKAAAGRGSFLTQFIGLFAIIFATINAVGGFCVTHRMLVMFKKKD